MMNTYYAKSTRSKKAGKTKTEQAYFEHLGAQKMAGRIIHYWHEPFNLRIGEGIFYSPDFLVAELDETLTIIEVKGCKSVISDHAVVKAKLAAEKFPFHVRMTWPGDTKRLTDWQYRNFGDDEDAEFFGIKSKEAK